MPRGVDLEPTVIDPDDRPFDRKVPAGHVLQVKLNEEAIVSTLREDGFHGELSGEMAMADGLLEFTVRLPTTV